MTQPKPVSHSLNARNNILQMCAMSTMCVKGWHNENYTQRRRGPKEQDHQLNTHLVALKDINKQEDEEIFPKIK